MAVHEARVAAEVIADELQDGKELANIADYTALCPQRQSVQIALRIAGSWIAAASVGVNGMVLIAARADGISARGLFYT